MKPGSFFYQSRFRVETALMFVFEIFKNNFVLADIIYTSMKSLTKNYLS